MRRWLQVHGWLIGVLAVASFAMLFRLEQQPIQNWDEGIHGAVSLEMVEDGDWLTPHYMGGPYFRKPPLKLWMSSALFDWFGANAWALRLPSAIAGIATSLLIAWWMWQWRRNRLDAFLAGTIVATMRPIFFHGFRTGEMDGLLTFWVVLALYTWWRITESSRPRWWVVLGATVGLSVMTKSAAGLLPVPIILAHAVITGAWRRITLRHFGLALLAFTAVAAPWHLAMTMLHGATFWNDYFGWHVIKRATEVLHNETAGVWWWYFPTFARRFTPYTYWFVPALLYSILSALRALRQRGKIALNHSSFSTQTLLLLWFLLGFTLFTLARTKFDWYLLPLYPAAVMLTVAFLTTARDAITQRSIAFFHLLAIAIAVVALPSLYPPGTWLDAHIERWYQPFGHPLVAATITVAVVIMLFRWLMHQFGNAVAARVAIITTVALMLIPGATVTYRHLVMSYPPNPFSSIAAAIHGSTGVLVSYGLDYKQSPAGYFILRSELRGDVRVLDGRSDVARTTAMLRERERGFLLTKREAELPKELRQVVDNPRTFGGYTLWSQ